MVSVCYQLLVYYLAQMPHNSKLLNLFAFSAAPRFLSPAQFSFDRPHDVNATDGEMLNVSCQSYAEPTAQVTWYQNAIPINCKTLHTINVSGF